MTVAAPDAGGTPASQLQVAYGALFAPKQAFRALPSERFYVLSVIAPLYFSFVNPRLAEGLRLTLGDYMSPSGLGLLRLILVLVSTPLFVVAGAWLLRQGLKLFKKRLTVVKLINIYGHALLPSVLFISLSRLLVTLLPSLALVRPSGVALPADILAGLVACWSLFLLLYGIAISPSEERLKWSGRLDLGRRP